MSTFTGFSRLPAELRLMIWKEALPQEDNAAVFPYGSACWEPTPGSDVFSLEDSDEDSDEDPVEEPMFLNFDHEKMGLVRVRLPMFFVNREARAEAKAWMKREGVKLRYVKKTRRVEVVRHFNPSRDIISAVTAEEWDCFIGSASNRLFDPRVFDENGRSANDHIKHIVTHESILRRRLPYSELLFLMFPKLKTLFVIFGENPDFEDKDACPPVRRGDRELAAITSPRWEIGEARGPIHLWNLGLRDFRVNSEENQSMNPHIAQAAEDWKAGLYAWGKSDFEIRPVVLEAKYLLR